MKASAWIDRLKAERGWDSDYRVAKELGVGRAAVSRYRNSGSTLDDDIAVKVAQALELEPEIIILDQHAERTSSEPARAALSGLLQRIAGKVLAGGGAGGNGPLDITSVTRAGAEGELQAPRSKRYASCHPRAGVSHTNPLQLLQRAVGAMLSYTPPLTTA